MLPSQQPTGSICLYIPTGHQLQEASAGMFRHETGQLGGALHLCSHVCDRGHGQAAPDM